MADSKAIEYAQEQVEMWAANESDVYFHVRKLHHWGNTEEEITTYLRETIEQGAAGSDWLTSEDGEQQAAFGDADGVTLDDIVWAEVIRCLVAD